MSTSDDGTRKVQSYRDLIVWQKAMSLAEVVYRITSRFPREEVYGLTSQMRRAAVSVASNIAEGQARNGRGEFMQFLSHARGSLAELETQIEISSRIGVLAGDHALVLRDSIAEVGRLLNGLRNSLSAPRNI